MLEGFMGSQGFPQPQQDQQPDPQTSFDVQRNPQDMQVMTDSMMYAPLLRQMDEGERAKQWPDIFNKLSEVNPKVGNMLDPTLPPSNEDLDMMMSKLPGASDRRPGDMMPSSTEAPTGARGIQLAEVNTSQEAFNNEMVKRQVNGQAPISYTQWKAEKEAQKPAEGDQANKPTSMLPSSNLAAQLNKIQDTSTMSDAEFIQKANFEAGKGGGAMQASLTLKNWKYDGAPANYQWKDPSKTVLEPIPEGPADLSVKQKQAEIQAKTDKPQTPQYTAMIETAKAQLPMIKSLMYNPDGSVNWNNVRNSNLLATGKAVPGTEGWQLSVALENAIQAITRAETQAAMPQAEVNNTRGRYQCSSFDSQESCVQKDLSLRMFVNRYLSLVHKNEKGDAVYDSAAADSADAEMKLRLQSKKEEWMKKQQEAYPNATPEDLNKFWYKKILDDPKLEEQIGKELKQMGYGKKE